MRARMKLRMQLHQPNQRNQSGFSIVEVSLIVFIVAALAVTGLVVYQRNKSTSAKNSVAVNSAHTTGQQQNTTGTQPHAPAPALDAQQTNACRIVATVAPSNWKTFTSNQYKFSISYPSDWIADTSGGEENNSSRTPILTELLFTPPGNQGPQYGIEVTGQSLADSITDWENSVKEAQSHSSGTAFSILGENSCTFNGNEAVRIDTKQSYSTINVYDTEFYVAANGYSYKFTTNYQNSSDPLTDASLLGVVESLRLEQ
jgi:Tfp pilus assembly protein PilV